MSKITVIFWGMEENVKAKVRSLVDMELRFLKF
jgi:hypothetical protein